MDIVITQPKDKPLLTINEAADYFNINTKKLYAIAAENLDSGFVLQHGTKYLFKRQRFEAYLDRLTAI